MHALSAMSYVYLLLTGLAFWTPAFYWIAIVLGGGYLSRVLHPWIGLVFTIAICWMLVTWRGDMRTTADDREWRKAMGHYMRNEDALVPPAGRFNFGQKQFFWLMVICGAALLISGIVLWFIDLDPARAPGRPLSRGAGARHRRAGDDRRHHHPHLHGRRGRSRWSPCHPARRRQRAVGPAPSRAVGGAGAAHTDLPGTHADRDA